MNDLQNKSVLRQTLAGLDIIGVLNNAIHKKGRHEIVRLSIPGLGQRGIIFVGMTKDVNSYIVSNPQIFSKGKAGQVLTHLQGAESLTSTIGINHPSRAVRKPILNAIDTLHIKAFTDGKFIPLLHELYGQLETPTDDVTATTHQHFSSYINTAFFNGKFTDFQQILITIQDELNKLLPKTLSQDAGFNLLARLIGLGTIGIESSASQIRAALGNLILEARHSNDDYGLITTLIDYGASDLEISGHSNGVLQGLLDTTGNTASAITTVWATYPELVKELAEKGQLRAFVQMVATIFSAAPIMLRETTEEITIGRELVPIGTKVAGGMGYSTRDELGVGLGFDVDFENVIRLFINQTPEAKYAQSALFGGNSHTHCVGETPAWEMLEAYLEYGIVNGYQPIIISGNPRYWMKLTGRVDNVTIQMVKSN